MQFWFLKRIIYKIRPHFKILFWMNRQVVKQYFPQKESTGAVWINFLDSHLRWPRLCKIKNPVIRIEPSKSVPVQKQPPQCETPEIQQRQTSRRPPPGGADGPTVLAKFGPIPYRGPTRTDARNGAFSVLRVSRLILARNAPLPAAGAEGVSAHSSPHRRPLRTPSAVAPPPSPTPGASRHRPHPRTPAAGLKSGRTRCRRVCLPLVDRRAAERMDRFKRGRERRAQNMRRESWVM